MCVFKVISITSGFLRATRGTTQNWVGNQADLPTLLFGRGPVRTFWKKESPSSLSHMSMSIQLPVLHCKHYPAVKQYRKSFHKGDTVTVGWMLENLPKVWSNLVAEYETKNDKTHYSNWVILAPLPPLGEGGEGGRGPNLPSKRMPTTKKGAVPPPIFLISYPLAVMNRQFIRLVNFWPILGGDHSQNH